MNRFLSEAEEDKIMSELEKIPIGRNRFHKPKQHDRYDEACWDTLSFVMNLINSYEYKNVPKNKLYADLLALRPTNIRKSNGK